MNRKAFLKSAGLALIAASVLPISALDGLGATGNKRRLRLIGRVNFSPSEAIHGPNNLRRQNHRVEQMTEKNVCKHIVPADGRIIPYHQAIPMDVCEVVSGPEDSLHGSVFVVLWAKFKDTNSLMVKQIASSVDRLWANA